MTRGYRSWFQDLINVWTMPATMLKNKVMYRQFNSQCRFCKLKILYIFKPFYLYFLDTPRTSISRSQQKCMRISVCLQGCLVAGKCRGWLDVWSVMQQTDEEQLYRTATGPKPQTLTTT